MRSEKTMSLNLNQGGCLGRVEELEDVLHVIRLRHLAAEDIDEELLALVAAAQADEQALEPLLAVEHEACLGLSSSGT